MSDLRHAEGEVEAAVLHGHFESLHQQAHAARFGMWLFLASEVLLFGGLFALFATYSVHFPEGFRQGVTENTKVLGSINTGVLLVSSWAIAGSVHVLRAGKRGLAGLLMMVTILLGGVFLVIKFVEYGEHFREGIFPGGKGAYFATHSAVNGLSEFWTLYFLTTGLHALHVTVGMTILSLLFISLLRKRLFPLVAHRLEIGAIYWHLVDVIWIFVWPLYYLA